MSAIRLRPSDRAGGARSNVLGGPRRGYFFSSSSSFLRSAARLRSSWNFSR